MSIHVPIIVFKLIAYHTLLCFEKFFLITWR